MIKFVNRKSDGTARLGCEFSKFDARVPLGLDELGLRPVPAASQGGR